MITRKHKPTPLVLTESQKSSLRERASIPSSGLGDLVERGAKPIARVLNRVGSTLLPLAQWLATVGQPNSTCGCKSRKSCLNGLQLSSKRPCKAITQIINCMRQK